MAATRGAHPQLLQAVMDINQNQRKRAVMKLEKALGTLEGKRIGVLGLSFKPNTDDTRDAPALDIIRMLLGKDALVQAFDPQAMLSVKEEIPQITLCQSPYEVAQDADALLMATEWNEFKSLDFNRIKANMTGRVVLDGRNLWDGQELQKMGFVYIGVGVPNPEI